MWSHLILKSLLIFVNIFKKQPKKIGFWKFNHLNRKTKQIRSLTIAALVLLYIIEIIIQREKKKIK